MAQPDPRRCRKSLPILVARLGSVWSHFISQWPRPPHVSKNTQCDIPRRNHQPYRWFGGLLPIVVIVREVWIIIMIFYDYVDGAENTFGFWYWSFCISLSGLCTRLIGIFSVRYRFRRLAVQIRVDTVRVCQRGNRHHMSQGARFPELSHQHREMGVLTHLIDVGIPCF